MTTPAADPRDTCYDTESYANVFTLAAKHVVTGVRWRFEYSHRRNDLPALFQWLTALRASDSRMVGFNNVGFDYPVLHYILNTQPTPTPAEINQFVQRIINAGHANRFDHIIWDRDRYVEQVDLFKIHHFDNVARATSLKVLEFNMRSDSIQDLPFEPGSTLTDTEIDELLDYNAHDVDKTEEFYFHTLDAIRFREQLSAKYGRNFLNDNDTKIGKQYFIMRLGETCYCTGPDGKRVPRQTIREQIRLADVIFPWISFRRPEFIAIRDWLAAQVITETKGVFEKLHCVVDGFQFDFGTGGVHGSVTSRTVESDADHVILDLDVASYYPNLAIANRLYPEHLGEMFCDVYQDVYEQRKGYKKGTPENAMFKLALNGVYGDSNNKYSPFYDPNYTMAITINGQLLLCLLAETLMTIPGLEMIQVNTDGLTVRIPRTSETHVDAICRWWESHTRLQLEKAEYSHMWIRDVNNYAARYTDGALKRKGAYEYVTTQAGGTLGWHQNHSALVVPMAAEAALVHGESVRDFILNHDNLHDFMLRAKVPRSSRLVLEAGGTVTTLQNIQRYFISKQGGSLIKIMPPLAKKPGVERRIGVSVGWAVTPCNEIAGVRGTDINMEYYITEAEKLVRPLQRG